MRWFRASLVVVASFGVGLSVAWLLGQAAQDLLAPDVPRPLVNRPEDVRAFLQALPPPAHAARLMAHGLGVFLAVAGARRILPQRRLEAWTVASMFAATSLAEAWVVQGPSPLAVAHVVTVLPCAWMGLRFTERRFAGGRNA